ncbi:hypothetical protein [Synechococcus sp. CCAP 1479/9]|uniref:hypothetical protein n=1 Tax=Synechococcus sp. CCAP 1479/9 TaxID=1221593 RepID=UPI001C21D70A|nr:hypothetical protein [Synechococcus sp. CCAP 1479/9]
MNPAISPARLQRLLDRLPSRPRPLPAPPPPTIPALSDQQAERCRQEGWQLRSEASADAWRPPAPW